MTAPSRVFIINFRFPPAPIGETTTLLRPAVPCLNFAFLRELKGVSTGKSREGKVHFWVVGRVRRWRS
jgi:hypothetical protein